MGSASFTHDRIDGDGSPSEWIPAWVDDELHSFLWPGAATFIHCSARWQPRPEPILNGSRRELIDLLCDALAIAPFSDDPAQRFRVNVPTVWWFQIDTEARRKRGGRLEVAATYSKMHPGFESDSSLSRGIGRNWIKPPSPLLIGG